MLRWVFLASSLFAACPAIAATVATDGDPSSRDPIGTSVSELVSKALKDAKCSVPGRPLTVAVLGFDLRDQTFTVDQKDYITNLIEASASKMENVQVANVRNIAGLSEAVDLGFTKGSDEEAAAIDKIRQSVDVFINALPNRSATGVMFMLKATSIKHDGCYFLTTQVPLPETLAGEQFRPPENLFQNAAREMWNASKGENDVIVRSESASDEEGRNLSRSFVRLMRQGIATVGDNPDTITIEAPSFNVIAYGEHNVQAEDRPKSKTWFADIAVEKRPLGYRLQIDLTREGQNPIAEVGLVTPDSMPAISADALPVATDTSRGLAVDRPKLAMTEEPQRVSDEVVKGEKKPKEYSINLDEPSVVEVDINSPDGGIAPKYALIDAAGSSLDPVFRGKTRPNLARYRLDAGSYFVRLDKSAKPGVEYLIRTRAARGALEPEPPGQLLRRYGDWFVGSTAASDGAKTCYAFTSAKTMEPATWRPQKPVVWFQISQKEDQLIYRFDRGEDYADANTISGTVTGSGKEWKLPIVLDPKSGAVMAAEACPEGGLCAPHETIKGFTAGKELVLKGETAAGEAGTVTYSLNGYQGAMYSMAATCGRKDFARKLVR